MDNAFAYWLNTTHGDDTEVTCLHVSVNVRVCVCVRVCVYISVCVCVALLGSIQPTATIPN